MSETKELSEVEIRAIRKKALDNESFPVLATYPSDDDGNPMNRLGM